MAKKYGSGRIIGAEQLQEGDFYRHNTSAKVRFEVKEIEIGHKVKVSTQVGEMEYALDRPLILVQRDGIPVPPIEG